MLNLKLFQKLVQTVLFCLKKCVKFAMGNTGYVLAKLFLADTQFIKVLAMVYNQGLLLCEFTHLLLIVYILV